jgi:hypothetical protein
VNSALHEKILHQDNLAALLARHPNERLAYFIGADVTNSPSEDEFPGWCTSVGVPEPVMGVRVGGVIVDAYWPAERLIAELDGWGSHNTSVDFENDRERDIDHLVIDSPTIRITRRKAEREPARLARQINTILANRRRQLGLAA